MHKTRSNIMRCIYLMFLCIPLLLTFPLSSATAQSQTVNGLRYTNDPALGGPILQISHDGYINSSYDLYRNGAQISNVSSNLTNSGGNGYVWAGVIGWQTHFDAGSNGDNYRVEPGGGSCTLQITGGYRYCGYTPPVTDNDGDGINNGPDQCPDDFGPGPHGCPDTDGDGYHDGEDACDNQGDLGYGLQANGCPVPPPDDDNDGVINDNDDCPAIPGLIPHGCPDADGDNVYDMNDNCPDEAGPASNRGCPVPGDRDGDGVTDDEDVCPDTNGILPNGCPAPDADGDGTPDNTDQCPTTSGPIWNGGCPQGQEPDVTPVPITPTPTQVVLPQANPNLECNLAPSSYDRINIREGIGGEPTGAIPAYSRNNPTIYVIGQATDAEGDIWYQLSDGDWVAGISFYPPAGTNCTELGVSTPGNSIPSVPTATPVPLVSAGELLGGCPGAVDWYNTQVYEIQQGYQMAENPCELYTNSSQNRHNNHRIAALLGIDNLNRLVDICGVDAFSEVETVLEELEDDAVLWESIVAIINTNDDCDSIIAGIAVLLGAVESLADVCEQTGSGNLIAISRLANSLGISEDDYDTALCNRLYQLKQRTTVVTGSALTFYNNLRQCLNGDHSLSIGWLVYAYDQTADFGRLAALPLPDLCPDIQSAIDNNRLPQMPFELEYCLATTHRDDVYNFWDNYNSENAAITEDDFNALLGVRPLMAICEAISDFIDGTGTIPPVRNPGGGNGGNGNNEDGNTSLPPITVITPDTGPIEPTSTPADDGQVQIPPSSPDIGVFTDAFNNATAVLVGLSDDGTSDVYLFDGGTFISITSHVAYNEYAPAFRSSSSHELAYIRERDGIYELVWRVSPMAEIVTPFPEGHVFHVDTHIAWHPGRSIIWVTLLDAAGVPTIYEFDMYEQTTVPIVTNGTNPIANSTHIIYERESNGITRLYIAPITNSTPAITVNAGSPILSVPQDVSCQWASIYQEIQILYLCDGTLYTSRIFGLDSPLAIGDLSGWSVRNLAIIPNTVGTYFTFDDSTTIYQSTLMPISVEEFLRVNFELTGYLDWR